MYVLKYSHLFPGMKKMIKLNLENVKNSPITQDRFDKLMIINDGNGYSSVNIVYSIVNESDYCKCISLRQTVLHDQGNIFR